MPCRAVIFDLDGTLLDTLADIVSAVNVVLAERGFPRHTLEGLRPMIGYGVPNLFERALPEPARTPPMVAECGQAYVDQYFDGGGPPTRLFDGMSDLLDEIATRGIPMAVLSNKAHPLTVGCVERSLGKWRWGFVQGAEPGLPHKPDPAGALQIAGKLGVDPTSVVFAGDTPVDVQTARAAGMTAVGVTWGLRPREDLSDADVLIDHPMQLIDVIDRR